jgi:hypothetical protein
MLTLTDLFAAAGGSSTGAIQIPGVEVRLAANHWQKAVEVHNANHPGADHLCADISAYDPRRIRSTDLLWASPECFTAGHLVMTARGQVPIERGQWRPVLGTRIGDRSKPLADKTRARIAAGIARYWRPFTLEAAGNTYERRPGVRTWPADDVLTTLHTTASKALAVPVEGRTGVNARPTDEALRTLTTRLDTSLVAAPFIAELRGGGSCARSVADALATVTAAGNHHALVTPYYGNTEAASPASETLGTLTTLERFALVMRNVNNRGASDLCSPADEVIRTLTASIPHSLIMRNNTGGPEMTTPTAEVLRTLTTGGHQSLITPGDIEAARAMVDDCLFRMFEPHEVAAGMAFPHRLPLVRNPPRARPDGRQRCHPSVRPRPDRRGRGIPGRRSRMTKPEPRV